MCFNLLLNILIDKFRQFVHFFLFKNVVVAGYCDFEAVTERNACQTKTNFTWQRDIRTAMQCSDLAILIIVLERLNWSGRVGEGQGELLRNHI